MKILIVKTSSLGDIIQSFPILNYLKAKFTDVEIDWVVEESLAAVVVAHPLIRKAISLDIKGLKTNWFRLKTWQKLFASIRHLREEKYRFIFDLQGNSKSGGITWLSCGEVKVGFGLKSVREWPNVLATQIRFEIPKLINIRLQHLRLLQQFFQDQGSVEMEGVRFKIDSLEREKIGSILIRPELSAPYKIMVCPGSKWINKQVPVETLISFLQRIRAKLNACFLLVWGGEAEKADCESIQREFPLQSGLVDRLPLPMWQFLMNEIDLVIAVDSSALHLCGTTSTPSFSLFGPTNPEIFKPIGQRHYAYQGKCPYGRSFEKSCPILRNCATGACIRHLDPEEIYAAFIRWWEAN